ncbi:hypothetical protein CK203_060674 [Vitis vinifera]|uniref:Uncharacterized protein n=1 Tax=Vitis vinifera TaxID=29760 RepID=A0A438GA70_VITVI|nr:hypothetical protein CK203_060674 [Vitis vinifera]
MMKKHMPPPFPQALHGKKGIKNSSEILEVLRQVKVSQNPKGGDRGCSSSSGQILLSVDFVVLDTDPTVKEANYVPIILGRPFLATSNAIINSSSPEEEEGLEEVCLINTLVEEHCDKNLEESLNESLGVLEEGLPEPSDVLAIMSPWRRREEILPLFNKEDSQGAATETL